MELIKSLTKLIKSNPSLKNEGICAKSGDWEIFKTKNGCAMTSGYDSKTSLTVIAMSEKLLAFWIQNPKWQSLSPDLKYSLEIKIDKKKKWNKDAYFLSGAKGPGLYWFSDIKPDKNGNNFTEEFARGNVMHIKRNNIHIDSLELNITYEATEKLMECYYSIRRDDPFAQ